MSLLDNYGVVLHATGQPADVRYEQVDLAVLGDSELACELVAAVIQPLDRQIAAGSYPGSRELPARMGSSGVGRTLQSAVGLPVGSLVAVLGGQAGQAMRTSGIFANQFNAPRSAVVLLPEGADPVAIAASGSSVVTAIHSLKDLASVQAGETVLVLGSSGSVGRAATQLASSLGATVIGASRGKRSTPGGEAVALDEDIVGSVMRLTDGGGVNVIIDCVGGMWTANTILAGAQACRHVCLGYSAGMGVSLSIGLLMLREHRLIGCNINGVTAERQREQWELAVRLIAEGTVGPEPTSVRPLSEAPAAFSEPDVRQRVVLVPGDWPAAPGAEHKGSPRRANVS